MKNKSAIPDLLSSLEKESSEHPIIVFGATNCGYEDEKRYYNLEELISDPPESYFTRLLSKKSTIDILGHVSRETCSFCLYG